MEKHERISPERGRLRCFVIDDHPIFGDAMTLAISEIFDEPEITMAGSLFDALEKIRGKPMPHFIVLDLNLPDVDGLDGLVRLKALAADSKVVIVSSLSDNRIIASALEEGAAGFVPKDSSREILIKAFQKIARGEIYTPPDYFTPRPQNQPENNIEILKNLASLTPRQATILRLICDGKLNKQIAFELSIAETTVKAHLTAIMRKLGAQNRTQAALLAKKVSFQSYVDSNQ